MLKLVSIILAVQNGEKYIAETISSLINQTFQDFELIIIVNCSTDNTISIVKSFTDQRIKLVETNICQLSFNLNYGLNLAIGKYIARIDADDIAHPKRIEKQIEILNKFDYDVIGSNIDLINSKGDYINTITFPETNKSIRRKILYRSVLAHPTVLIKKDILLANSGYLGGQYAQDYDLWLRLMRDKKIQFYNIQESLLQYRIHSNQTKGNKNSYAEVAGYMLKESIYSKKITYIIGAFIYYFKSVLLGTPSKNR